MIEQVVCYILKSPYMTNGTDHYGSDRCVSMPDEGLTWKTVVLVAGKWFLSQCSTAPSSLQPFSKPFGWQRSGSFGRRFLSFWYFFFLTAQKEKVYCICKRHVYKLICRSKGYSLILHISFSAARKRMDIWKPFSAILIVQNIQRVMQQKRTIPWFPMRLFFFCYISQYWL